MKRFRLIYMLAVAAVMFLAACQNDSPGCTIDEVAAALSAVILVNGKLNYLKKRRPKSPLTMLISKMIIFF